MCLSSSAILAQFSIKSISRNPQQQRRFGPIPLAHTKRTLDSSTFKLFHREWLMAYGAVETGRYRFPEQRLEIPISNRLRIVSRDRGTSFENILEFAHVAWERVVEKQLDSRAAQCDFPSISAT